MNRLMDWLRQRWQHLQGWIMNVRHPARLPLVTMPTDRHELFEQLRTLRERRASAAAEHRQAMDELTGQLTILQGQVDTVHHQINRLQHTNLCASLDHTAAEDRLLSHINTKSSMSVQLFIEELDRELDVLNRTEDVAVLSPYRDYAIGKKTVGLSTDAPSRRRRATALHQARQRARQMQLEELSVEQLTTELLRLKKTLPAVEHEVIHNERASIVAHV